MAKIKDINKEHDLKLLTLIRKEILKQKDSHLYDDLAHVKQLLKEILTFLRNTYDEEAMDALIEKELNS